MFIAAWGAMEVVSGKLCSDFGNPVAGWWFYHSTGITR